MKFYSFLLRVLFLTPCAFLFGCTEKERNPDIRYLLDLAKADSRYDELYRQFKENVRTPGVSVTKSRMNGASLESWGAMEYNPRVPDVSTFDSMIVVKVRGREWSYEAVFFFTGTNSLAATSYAQWFRMPPPEIKPIDWHMKWEKSAPESATNALEGEVGK